ncbi:hypothetical protein P12x_006109 (plasmid) [Tundrisphaera lichenicola]|uniref:hypothetical protein n=1 Tax=Tundrisphaera lichenicola TaxID=2029860 RepID=UPI003EBFC27D
MPLTLDITRGVQPLSDHRLRRSATLVRDEARALADADPADAGRYRQAASGLEAALRDGGNRETILRVSPFVIERSGRFRTIVEMIEDEPGDDEARRRLARLLLRALEWR